MNENLINDKYEKKIQILIAQNERYREAIVAFKDILININKELSKYGIKLQNMNTTIEEYQEGNETL